MTIVKSRVLIVLALIVLLSACTPFARHGVPVQKDNAPSLSVDPQTIRDATPRKDKITRAGNKNPYTVLGKTYHLLPTSKGYREEGIASWYGTKFQGRPTANGEAYNLYAMTAAHRTLPIPAYVKVTNLANMRSAIVRVNDRGPFHRERIIDLSYAAAVKLGYDKLGTARVRIEAIDVDSPQTKVSRIQSPNLSAITSDATVGVAAVSEAYYLQAGAFKNLQLANNLRLELKQLVGTGVSVNASEPPGFYRVQIGPIAGLEQAEKVSDKLVAMGRGRPRLITR